MPLLTPRLRQHPCFGGCGAGSYGRIHLPVAPRCNVQCAFCQRKYDCVNESRPGVTSQILTPEQALLRTREAVRAEPRIRVAGIAGPGDPLANDETFETLRLVHSVLPELICCLSTNGLWLEERLEELLDCGVETLTVTVNTRNADTAAKIYRYVQGPNGPLTGAEAGEYLVEKQRRGLEMCRDRGLAIKLNTVLIPGINDGEIGEIAQWGKALGASVMNVMPLIPCGSLASWQSPTLQQLAEARRRAAEEVPILAHCRQCRADAVGIV